MTHIANKVKAHVQLVEGPPAGEARRLHPPGYDADLAAAAGASRSAEELREDLAASLILLEEAWDGLDEAMWDQSGIMMAGSRTMIESVNHHLRNIEVHHVDLNIGYGINDWSAYFVEAELTRRLPALTHRANHADLLAWLLNRGQAPDLVNPW